MKLFDILKTVGSGLVRNLVPGGAAIVDTVNAFLPDNAKLPSSASGDDVQRAVESLPPEQRAAVMEREYDVKIEDIRARAGTLQAMLQAEQASTHTTRPYIAKGSFHVLSFVVMVTVSLWAYAVAVGDEALVRAVTEGWPFVLGVVGPFVGLLYAYFGVLRKEQAQRLDAAGGHGGQSGIGGVLAAILKR